MQFGDRPVAYEFFIPQLPIGLFIHQMHRASSIVKKRDSQGGVRIRRDLHKSPRWLVVEKRLFDQALGIGGFRVTGFDAGVRVFIVERTDREFLNSCGMNAVVLPVAVAAKDKDIFDFLHLQPREKRVRLGAESRGVRVVVALAGAVGANHRRGRNEDFPFRIAGRERALEPLALFGAPERFFY